MSSQGNEDTPVIVYPAVWWECKCGKTNFAKWDTVEVSPEDKEAQPEAFDGSETGDLHTVPGVVECSGCGIMLDVDATKYDEFLGHENYEGETDE